MDKLRGHYQVHLNGAHSKVMPQAKQHGHHNRKWWDITIIITKFWNLNAAQMKLRSAMLSRLWSWTKANGILRTELSATLSASKKGVKTKEQPVQQEPRRQGRSEAFLCWLALLDSFIASTVARVHFMKTQPAGILFFICTCLHTSVFSRVLLLFYYLPVLARQVQTKWSKVPAAA